MNNIVIGKWFFPAIAMLFTGGFYAVDQTSISPVGLILIIILTFIGVSMTERLDRIIEIKETVVINNNA